MYIACPEYIFLGVIRKGDGFYGPNRKGEWAFLVAEKAK